MFQCGRMAPPRWRPPCSPSELIQSCPAACACSTRSQRRGCTPGQNRESPGASSRRLGARGREPVARFGHAGRHQRHVLLTAAENAGCSGEWGRPAARPAAPATRALLFFPYCTCGPCMRSLLYSSDHSMVPIHVLGCRRCALLHRGCRLCSLQHVVPGLRCSSGSSVCGLQSVPASFETAAVTVAAVTRNQKW